MLNAVTECDSFLMFGMNVPVSVLRDPLIFAEFER